VNLSTRPEKSIGSDDIWEKAESALVTALNKKGWSYKVDEGGGAFYGPKIDLKIRDAVGRVWQCSTVQCDFNLPERFDLEYVSAESGRDRPIMIHRAIFGSVERFFGILVENYAGDFPLWFAPEQIRLLAVNDDVVPYCEEVVAKMKKQVGSGNFYDCMHMRTRIQVLNIYNPEDEYAGGIREFPGLGVPMHACMRMCTLIILV